MVDGRTADKRLSLVRETADAGGCGGRVAESIAASSADTVTWPFRSMTAVSTAAEQSSMGG